MCGRFTVTRIPEDWLDALGLGDVPELEPRYNVSPSQPVLAVAHDVEEDRNLLRYFDWGLLPSWAKEATGITRPINARAETASEKPYFRSAMRHHRCLVPADGFYEWSGKGQHRRPHYFQLRDAEPFAFAGLWEHWDGPRGEYFDTLALLTTSPNALVKPVHNRMPVILEPNHFTRWLDPTAQSSKGVQEMLVPFPADRMQVRPVNAYVNSPRNEGPRCIEPPDDELF